ncbi:MAG: tyrosine-type recombinase/integrase [Mucilaginibacter polytrichastri]|nr:tyrosine-type recombinase/integrase [Mucilaginibacter polytrichastri]
MGIEVKVILWSYRKVAKGSQNLVIGEHEIRIRLTRFRDVKYIGIGYSSSTENWNKDLGLPNATHPHYLKISGKIQKYLDDINFEIASASKGGWAISPIELKDKVSDRKPIHAIASTPNKVLAYFDMQIQKLENQNNIGYANIFTNVKMTVEKLLGRKDKQFTAFTIKDHRLYEELVCKGKAESTTSHYLRTYYRIWNLAIKDGHCRKDQHPSNFISFRAYKIIRTRKRSIGVNYLQAILALELSYESRLFRTQKQIQFLYYSRGMNFGDMCKLKNDWLINGGLSYTRSKNKRLYNFELHPKALAAINIFKKYPIQSDAGYIFPILMEVHNNARKIDTRIESALSGFNQDFKFLAKEVGWNLNVGSNDLRHSFASHLRDSGVEIAIIQEAMGHETEMQTRVYLKHIDDGIIAKAILRALR